MTTDPLAHLTRSQKLELLKLLELKAERDALKKCQHLVEFIKQAWHVLEPTQPYIHGWHMDALAEHLEACTNGDITRLLINIPPGTMKSLATSVFWPAWMWGPKGMPSVRFIGASHSENLAIRDNLKMRRLVTSEWFQSRWPVKLVGDQSQKSNFETEETGWRQSSPVTSMTGKRANFVIWDDPHSVEDAYSPTKLETANRIFRETLPTRVVDPEKSVIVVIMQRLNEADVSGEILKSNLGYEHLCLPMEYEGPRPPTKIGFQDPRREMGELLFPQRFPRAVVERDKKIMGEYATAGQFQQRPAPVGGGILKAKNFRLWPAKFDLPDLFMVVTSMDTAYTEKTSGDPSAATVWGVFEHEGRRNVLLLDAWAEHLAYPDLRERTIADWSAQYGGVKNNPLKPSRKPDFLLVEAKGSGQSLLADLHAAGVPAVGYNPGAADKITRAHLAAPMLELGVFWVMESKREPGKPISWARAFLSEIQTFPAGAHDDYTDSYTQMCIFLRDKGQIDLAVAPEEEVKEIDYNARRKRLRNPYG